MTGSAVPRALADAEVLSAWTEGRDRSNPDRAIAMLVRALPDVPMEDLDGAPVGVRDGWILDLRAATFGSRIEALTACPRCGERIEAWFDVSDVRIPATPPRHDDRTGMVDAEGFRLTVRSPSTLDLRAAAACGTDEEARSALVARCIVAVERDGEPVAHAQLSEAAVLAAGRWIEIRDGQADVRLAMTCPACEHGWDAELDVVGFVWEELGARARRLLADVHALARAYGWTESEILHLPEPRRRAYLDLVTS